MNYPQPGETWKHYKGSTYLVLLLMTDSETHQTRIAYTDGSLTWDRVVSGTNPDTGQLCGWCDPLPDGSPRYEKVA